MSLIVVDAKKCKHCGRCVEVCPEHIIQTTESDSVPFLDESDEPWCITCGHCVAICPQGAMGMQKMTPSQCTSIKKRLMPSSQQVEHFMKTRRSIRLYKDKTISQKTLAKLIDIASYAPSGHNSQSVHWLVISDTKEIKELNTIAVDWMRRALEESPELAGTLNFQVAVGTWDSGIDVITRNAPHIIIAHTHKELGRMGSCQIALTHLELAAHSLGLGACWAGYLQLAAASYSPLSKALHLPKDHRSYGIMLIGYPKYDYHRIPLRNDPSIIWR